MLETGGMSDTGKVQVRNRQIVVDGPFTETKELIGGYALYDLPTQAEIIAWTKRFADLHREHWPAWEGEITIQQLHVMPK